MDVKLVGAKCQNCGEPLPRGYYDENTNQFHTWPVVVNEAEARNLSEIGWCDDEFLSDNGRGCGKVGWLLELEPVED